mmetsp:Transcript_2329/g.4973  ORF Transcript_2329/g.4973 Transcript_2329/m.4973 type:complete len:401 (+) Transcript_2329:60-1262(+)
MRRPAPCIDVTLVNNDDDSGGASPDRNAATAAAADETHHRHYHHHRGDISQGNSPLSSTLRTDGLSIGFDYFRFEGSAISFISPSRLELEGTIGRGACSVVRLARAAAADGAPDDSSGRNSDDDDSSSTSLATDENRSRFALKTSPIRDPARRKMMIKELRVLCRLDCDCLVRLVGAFFDIKDGMMTVVLEYMDKGSLKDLIRLNKETGIPKPQLASIAYQMLWGLAFLHFENLLHRDIKPSNTLLAATGRVKLSDFGISAQRSSQDDMNTTLIGTTFYMSPERLRGKQYGSPSDIWSLGLVLLECAIGTAPFHDTTSTIDLILTLEETPSEELIPTSMDDDVREMISSCLQIIPEERMPADVLLASPWLSKEGMTSPDVAALFMKRYYDEMDSSGRLAS